MSQENVEIVKRGNEAFRRGDWEAVAEVIDPHISIRTDASWPEQRIYGREAALAFYRGVAESGISDIRIDETIDLGDRVLVRLRLHMRGSYSGAEGEQYYSMISTLRDGRVILDEFFLDHTAALKAVGLAD
jgi:ketosteroid isomerase-like protein